MDIQQDCIYMLLCSDNTLYTGWTNDLSQRVTAHNEGHGAKYTRSRLPVQLVYCEYFGTKSEAMKREFEIKRLNKTQKLKLIKTEADEICSEAKASAAKDQALTILTRSSLSGGMLEDKLRRYYDHDLAKCTVMRMIELNLINDLDYGNRLARDLLNLRGYAARRIILELNKRKIDKDTIVQIMSQFKEEDDLEAAKKLMFKKYKNKISEKKDIEKTMAAMQRRGFSFHTIRSALQQIQPIEFLDEIEFMD